MKTKLVLFLICLLVAITGGFVFFNNDTPTGNAIFDSGSGELQKVTISEKDLNYYPSEITVKAGQPVEITLDKKVQGCLRSFTIKDLGVSKYLKDPDDTIVFTPTKKGTFTFACSMGMGYGKITVV